MSWLSKDWVRYEFITKCMKKYVTTKILIKLVRIQKLLEKLNCSLKIRVMSSSIRFLRTPKKPMPDSAGWSAVKY